MTLTPAVATSGPRDAIALRADAVPPHEAAVDVLVLVVGRGVVPTWLDDYAEPIRALGDGERLILHRGDRSAFLPRLVEVVVLAAPTREAARRAGRAAGSAHRGIASIAVAGLPVDAVDDPVLAFVSGFAEGRYRFTRYARQEGPPPAELAVVGVSPESLDPLAARLAQAEVVEAGVRLCRDLTNTPARDMTPAILAEHAIREAPRWGAQARVLDETWLEAEAFAGLCAVGAGSPNPPRLVEVVYRGAEAADVAPVVLVGKGITFDSGGLSLKRASAMVEMKSDMAGAATALAVVFAIARLAPPRAHVVALMPLAENLPGPGALRPGDVLRHRNGIASEVVNTDCEGRLVLSDVLVWAAERDPAAIVDIATLTYSTIAALGTEVTAVLGTDPRLVADIRAAGEATGDPYWELPLWAPYRRLIDSSVADIRNEETEDGAGVITAALFLREFVGAVPWAHLDTGGTAFLEKETDDLAAGATGCGVRSLARLVLDRQDAGPHRPRRIEGEAP